MKDFHGNFRGNDNNIVQIDVILKKGNISNYDEFVEQEGGSDEEDGDEAWKSKQQILKNIEKARKVGMIPSGNWADDEDDHYWRENYD